MYRDFENVQVEIELGVDDLGRKRYVMTTTEYYVYTNYLVGVIRQLVGLIAMYPDLHESVHKNDRIFDEIENDYRFKISVAATEGLSVMGYCPNGSDMLWVRWHKSGMLYWAYFADADRDLKLGITNLLSVYKDYQNRISNISGAV